MVEEEYTDAYIEVEEEKVEVEEEYVGDGSDEMAKDEETIAELEDEKVEIDEAYEEYEDEVRCDGMEITVRSCDPCIFISHFTRVLSFHSTLKMLRSLRIRRRKPKW